MITGFSHLVQISVLVKSIGTGYFLGLTYSVIMLFNAFYGKHIVSVFIRDVLFFISAAFISFLFILKYNGGTLRFYILAGEGIGFLLFYIFPGSIAGAAFRKAAKRIISMASHFRQKLTVKAAKIKEKHKKNSENRKRIRTGKKEKSIKKREKIKKSVKRSKVKTTQEKKFI